MAIEEREVRRLGATKGEPADVWNMGRTRVMARDAWWRLARGPLPRPLGPGQRR